MVSKVRLPSASQRPTSLRAGALPSLGTWQIFEETLNLVTDVVNLTMGQNPLATG